MLHILIKEDVIYIKKLDIEKIIQLKDDGDISGNKTDY